MTKANPIDFDVIVYTDGACSGNPGPGGWAALLKDVQTGRALEISGGEPSTTNNRMELLAVIEGLRQVKTVGKSRKILVVSDSKYVVTGIKEWVPNWERNGWRTADKKPVKNKDLWETLVTLSRAADVKFEWVQAHAGHPENERVDELAVAAYQGYLK